MQNEEKVGASVALWDTYNSLLFLLKLAHWSYQLLVECDEENKPDTETWLLSSKWMFTTCGTHKIHFLMSIFDIFNI